MSMPHDAAQELVDKARRLLSDADFAAFRQASGDFMAGRVDAAELHRRTEALGAATLVPDVAALCPDPDKRRELLAAYREAAQDGTRSKVCQLPDNACQQSSCTAVGL